MFEDYKFRCSGLGSLMTNGRGKGEMGETCKSYLEEIYAEKVFQIKRDITNKYIQKGLMVEDSAIAFYSTLKGDFFHKNEERFTNDFVTGFPDIITDTEIIDIKSSWNFFTFKDAQKKVNKNYFYQLQGYMWLTDRSSAKLTYVLINTPEQLIQDEARRLGWKMGVLDDIDETYIQAVEELRQQMTFDQIPLDKRIFEHTIERDEKAIDDIKNRVLEGREYLETL